MTEGKKVLLMKPQTFMNLSGEAVAEACNYYNIPPERVIVVCDDVALPFNRIRIRLKGSAGGHNGIKSIIQELGSQEFPRIKIGVGAKPHPDYDLADWVLSHFTAQEEKALPPALERDADAALSILDNGIPETANRFNGSGK